MKTKTKTKEQLQKELEQYEKIYFDLDIEKHATQHTEEENRTIDKNIHKVAPLIESLRKQIANFDFEVAAKAFEKKWGVRIPRGDEYITSPSMERWKNSDLSNFR
jgi:hypothetical protein